MPYVWVVRLGLSYRPAPAVRERPELAAAFERGVAERDADERDGDYLMGLSPDERAAYWTGAAAGAPSAPAPLWFGVPCRGAVFFATAAADPHGDRLERWSWAVLALALGGLEAVVGPSLGARRARRLGLTRERRPVASGTTACLTVPMQLATVLALRVGLRLRTGRWPRASRTEAAAAALVGDFAHRRSFNAALARLPPDRAAR